MSLLNQGRRVRANMRKKFLRVYAEQRCNASQTRQILGLGLHTFDKWMKRYPKFAAKIIEIEEAMVDRIEVQLVTNAELGKQRAIEFYLTNRRKKRYSNTQKIEATGEDGGPIVYKEVVYKPTVPISPPAQKVNNPVEEETAEAEKKDD